jgi:hypothetical protein
MTTAHPRFGPWVASRWDSGTETDQRVYFGAVRPDAQDADEPQAFVVRLPAAHEGLRVHFHPVDQFQVFISGSGAFAGHEVRCGLVHYADALTPYGPLDVGGDGVAFMTLRHQADFDIQNMPNEAAQLAELRRRSLREPGKRRNLVADLLAPGAPGTWQRAFGDADGLEAATRTLDPGEPVPVLHGAVTGAYVLLVAGSLIAEDATLTAGALTWVTPACEGSLPAVAGLTGARLARLQFPAQQSDLENSAEFLAAHDSASGAS